MRLMKKILAIWLTSLFLTSILGVCYQPAQIGLPENKIHTTTLTNGLNLLNTEACKLREKISTSGPQHLQNNSWTEMPPKEPIVEYEHAMAYDSESDRVILYGGEITAEMYSAETWTYDFDTNTWTSMATSVKPSARSEHAMAYDSESDKVILFGGRAEGYNNGTWAYDFNTNTWTNMTTSIKPSARSGHAMAYDSESDRVILFGGRIHTGVYSADTWAYDSNTNTWTNMTTSIKPSARAWHAMVYDSESDRVILFGGLISTGVYSADTWAYDFNTNTWTNMATWTKPPARYDHAMAYDSESDRTILFGGSTRTYPCHDDETWVYDFNTNAWTNTTTAKLFARWAHAMAYDSKSDRVILFGRGYGGKTWAYDFNTNTWMNMNLSHRPAPSHSRAMAYDSESDRIILFGGLVYAGVDAETWAYDFNTNTWTDMGTSRYPVARAGHAMAYDSESDRVILFGGWGETTYCGDTWAYDFNTNIWTGMATSIRPSARAGHAMAYDSESDRVILYGGDINTGVYSADTWAYDFNTNTWTNMTTSIKPSARTGHAMAYDSQSDKVILFGGWAEGYNNETWAYDFNTNTWTNMTTNIKPSARSGHAMAYDSESDRVILFSGRIHTGVYSADTWAYDFNTNTWTNMTTSIKPSARARHAMAYDSQSDRTILFGGSFWSDGMIVYFDDTWAYDYSVQTANQPPTAVIDSITPNPATEGQTVTLTGHGTDTDGFVVAYNWRSNIDGQLSTLSCFNISSLSVGTHTIYFKVQDDDGAWSTEASANLVVNAMPQFSRVDVLPSSATIQIGGTQQFTAKGYDQNNNEIVGLIFVWEVIDGIGTIDSNGLFTAGKTAGSGTVTATATYNGVTKTGSASVTVTSPPPLPNQLPKCSISSPSDGATVSGTVTISGTASDTDGLVQKVEIRIDYGNWIKVNGTTTWSYIWDTTKVSDGQHTIYAQAYDSANCSNIASISVTVNNTVVSNDGVAHDFKAMIVTVLIIVAICGAVQIIIRCRKRRVG